MAGVTSAGFETKTYQEIFNEITEEANSPEYFGDEFPTTVDSAFGILNAVFSAAIKDSSWDNAEAVYNQLNRDKAEGKNLDDIAAYVSISRLKEAPSKGELLFKGSNLSIIPEELSVEDNNGNTVVTTEEVTYDRTNCYSVEIVVANLQNSNEYVIQLDGSNYVYTSGTSATDAEILEAFELAIGDTGNAVATLNDDSSMLYITRSFSNNGMSVVVDSDLSVQNVEMFVGAEATENGALTLSANTLTSITTPGDAIGTVSVYNPEAFEEGREEETDEELRLRLAEADDSSDAATNPSVQSALEELDGVSVARIFENITAETDSDGRPPKSYECLVVGGSEQAIGEVLWDLKPLGIETYGNIQVIVEDTNGDSQTVYFSRSAPKYAHVQVVYTLYSEEEFPSDGEAMIVEAVTTYGNTLSIGEDIIPQRFNGKIFEAVDGLASVTTSIGVTDTEGGTPVYQTTPITISELNVASFDSSRVTVSI